MNIKYLPSIVIWTLALGPLTANPSDPLDPGTSSILRADHAYSRRLPFSGVSEVTIRFDRPVDPAGVANIGNYSLRQLSPSLGAKNPGGTLEDLDGDGDLDMVHVIDNRILAYENVGTASNPRYSSQERTLAWVGIFNSSSWVAASYGVSVSFGDLDGDGDADMICGEGYHGQISCFMRNNVRTEWPIFDYQSRVMATVGGNSIPIETREAGDVPIFLLSVPNIAMEDLNGDGMLDMVIGDRSFSAPNIRVYRGTHVVEGGSPVFAEPVYLRADGVCISLDGFYEAISPAFCDVDGDGDQDLIVSNSNGKINNYLAEGLNSDVGSDNCGLPLYHADGLLLDSEGRSIELGRVLALHVADFSNDGAKDLIVVNRVGYSSLGTRMRVLENLDSEGLNLSAKAVEIDLSDYITELRSAHTSIPTYFDFDNDKKVDVLYMGSDYGMAIAYNLDTGNGHQPVFGVPRTLPISDESRLAIRNGVPEVVDFGSDKEFTPQTDGVLVGTNTNLLFMRFTGFDGNGLPQFDEPVSVLPAGMSGSYVEPTVGDMDKNGTLDVIIGSSWSLKLLLNSAQNGFSLASSPLVVGGIQENCWMFPEMVDIEGDGDQDILFSGLGVYPEDGYGQRLISGKTVRLLRNNGGQFTNEGVFRWAADPAASIWSDSIPRVVDFDQNGALDLMVGTRDSSVRVFMAGENPTALGLVVGNTSTPLTVNANLPVSAQLDSSRRFLTLLFSTYVQVGSELDLNELWVNGVRTSLSNRVILDYYADDDNDGFPDGWENSIYLDPDGDYDGDGRSNLWEFENHTNPWAVDTDGDGITDLDDLLPKMKDHTPVLISNALRILTPNRP